VADDKALAAADESESPTLALASAGPLNGLRYCPQCRAPSTERLCPADGTTTFELRGVDVARATQLPAGAVIAGRYRIENRLGKGGFGAVYEARHTASGQQVALKLLALDPEDAGEETYFRFFQEARVTANLRHPNTVRLYDFGQDDDGVLYMAMEVLRGPTLEKYLKQLRHGGQVMTEAQAAALGVQVLKSLQEAHGAGLVHRDLKPDNLILHDVGEDDPVVKVLDFGIARQQNSGMTQGARLMGTPMYMSPEQCYGATDLDARSDLYSLGVILYRCVTGVLPFQGDMFALLNAHMHEPPPDLRSAAQTPLGEAFVAAVERALAKLPGDRWQDSRAMRRALEGSLGGTGTPVSVSLRPAAPVTEVAVVADPGAHTVALTPATLAQPTQAVAAPPGPAAVPARPRANRWLIGGMLAVCIALAVAVAAVVSRPADPPFGEPTTPAAAVAPPIAPSAATAAPLQPVVVRPASTAAPAAPEPAAGPASAPSGAAPAPADGIPARSVPSPRPAAADARPRPKPARPATPDKPATDGKPKIQYMD